MTFFVADFIGKSAYHIEGVDHPTLAMVEEYLNLHGKGHTFEELLALPYIFDQKETKADSQGYELSVCAAIGQYIGDNNLIPDFTIYADAKQIDKTYNVHQIDVYYRNHSDEENHTIHDSDRFSLEYFTGSEELKLSVWVENRWLTTDRISDAKEIAVQLLKVLDKFNEVNFK